MPRKKKTEEIENAEVSTPDLSKVREPVNHVAKPSGLLDKLDNITSEITNLIPHEDFPSEMHKQAYDAITLIKVIRFKTAAK